MFSVPMENCIDFLEMWQRLDPSLACHTEFDIPAVIKYGILAHHPNQIPR